MTAAYILHQLYSSSLRLRPIFVHVQYHDSSVPTHCLRNSFTYIPSTADTSRANMAIEALQSEWNTLYRTTLPSLARGKHTAKTAASPSDKWPVVLDHCFARIILDNAVGQDRPWAEVVKAPATKNMTETQLNAALKMGRRIADGEEDLWALDARSLELRGKQQKAGMKRKREGQDEHTQMSKKTVTDGIHEADRESDGKSDKIEATVKEEEGAQSRVPDPAQKTRKQEMTNIWSTFSPSTIKQSPTEESESLARARKLIAADTNSKPFRKHVLTLLTQVPRGRYTTYQALSDAAVRLDPKKVGTPSAAERGNARAIGGAMRNNPFAPTVPCHRVLASSGKLGGFGGSWGEDGKFADEKKRLLREEGVRFDGSGKVVGSPFTGFWDYRGQG